MIQYDAISAPMNVYVCYSVHRPLKSTCGLIVRSVGRKIFLCMTHLLLAYAINGWCDRFGHRRLASRHTKMQTRV